MDTDLDARLRQALRTATATIDPPVNELVRGGISRGRRRRRTRITAIAGVAAAMIVVSGTLAVPRLWLAPDVAPSVATDTPAASPTVLPFDESAVIETVRALLPKGDVSAARTYAGEVIGWELIFDDGAGPSLLQGSVAVRTDSDDLACPVLVNGGECTVAALPDGSDLMTITGPYYPQADREPDRQLWSVSLYRSDGMIISVSAMNAPEEKGAITRPDPPLSVGQLTQLVASGRWIFDRGAWPSRTGEVAADAENPESATQDEAEELLATDLGWSWHAAESGDAALPSAALMAELPEDYYGGFVTREVSRTADLDEYCRPGGEKGTEKDECIEMLSPSGETVYVQWMRAESVAQDTVRVLAAREEGMAVVSLWIAGPPELSTDSRRTAAVEWLEARVADLIRAATTGT